MKKFICFLLTGIAVITSSQAQQKVPPKPLTDQPAKIHESRLGPQNLFYIGAMQFNSRVGSEVKFSDYCIPIGLQLGRGVSENLILYFLMEYTYAPKTEFIGIREGNFHDLVAGSGLNYYLRKDFFISANINYGIINMQVFATSTSDGGTAYVTKPGIGGGLSFGGDKRINDRLMITSALVCKYRTGKIDEYDSNVFVNSISGKTNTIFYVGVNFGLKFTKKTN